ncbi:MAG: FecR family protein [Chlorobi bacterium]|nr:FecR family protein [Chlorobiota bacterium]
MKKADNITYNEIYTPMSAQTRFLLPDSTVVWLNSASTLRYPLSFTGKTREVILTGEGYFDVVKNPKKPFVVQTKKINVIAYGTSFDVMAYPDDPKVAATLVKGKIKVVKKNTGKYFDLKPSSQAVLDTVTGKMTVSKVETRFYTSWKDGKLIFKSEPMEIVVHKLERWFNCKIHIQNDQLKKYKYTGTIEMETLREVMELIKITTPIKYKYDKDTREIWIEPI